jgi:hypothetical protein
MHFTCAEATQNPDRAATPEHAGGHEVEKIDTRDEHSGARQGGDRTKYQILLTALRRKIVDGSVDAYVFFSILVREPGLDLGFRRLQVG